jgi:hypothetical protein
LVGHRSTTVTETVYRPTHDDHGDSVTVGLPNGRTLGDVLAQRDRLASAMRVASGRLHVTQDPELPANCVTITVTHGNVTETAAEVGPLRPPSGGSPSRSAGTTTATTVCMYLHEQNSIIGGNQAAAKPRWPGS